MVISALKYLCGLKSQRKDCNFFPNRKFFSSVNFSVSVYKFYYQTFNVQKKNVNKFKFDTQDFKLNY